jgi:hypothetical protein
MTGGMEDHANTHVCFAADGLLRMWSIPTMQDMDEGCEKR